MKISRERIERIRQHPSPTAAADTTQIAELLTALDERDELIAHLHDTASVMHSELHHTGQKENCVQCLELWEAAEFLRGTKWENGQWLKTR